MRNSKPADAAIRREVRRVLRLEARALARLSGAVDGTYAQAVRALARCRGKVIVTGVGKSGLVAQ
ncbi:MAG: D-arabinose 5-phosphate isomerase, partial [Elusimicrobia bacterium]|nr:D-arabinose 5-phosphate isomerase [Elusimicrobiota bacterium]